MNDLARIQNAFMDGFMGLVCDHQNNDNFWNNCGYSDELVDLDSLEALICQNQ